MKVTRLAAAICGMALVSGSAEAALTFSTARSPVVNTTFERVVLYALSDASTGPSANVFAGDLTVSTPTANGLKFSVTDTDDDGVPDSVNAFQTPVVNATRTRADTQIFSLIAAAAPDPRSAGSAAVFQPGLNSWAITAAAANDGVGYLANSTVNSGLGYAVITAVVPAGSTVSFAGDISDANPTKYAVAVTDVVPEPTSLAFAGIAAVGLLGRRGRRA